MSDLIPSNPKPASDEIKAITVRMSGVLYDQIGHAAVQCGYSRSAWLRQLATKYFEKVKEAK